MQTEPNLRFCLKWQLDRAQLHRNLAKIQNIFREI